MYRIAALLVPREQLHCPILHPCPAVPGLAGLLHTHTHTHTHTRARTHFLPQSPCLFARSLSFPWCLRARPVLCVRNVAQTVSHHASLTLQYSVNVSNETSACGAAGSTPNCAAGMFQPGPPPACSGGGNPTCDNGMVGPNQPCDGGGGGGDSGASPSTSCTYSSGECATDGSSNYHAKSGSWAYDSGTGKFSGTLTTNLCSNNAYGVCVGCTSSYNILKHSADCIDQVIPAPAYSSGSASAAPLRGRVGLTLEGVNIYGPMEVGGEPPYDSWWTP